jgi:hypothetical protein
MGGFFRSFYAAEQLYAQRFLTGKKILPVESAAVAPVATGT